MSYTVLVDLSAKVEQWSKNTAVTFSDGIKGSILISKRVKKATRDWLKIRYSNRSKAFYRYNLLAAFVYLLLKPNLSKIEHIVIDKDYPGLASENQIKGRLLQFFHRENLYLRGDFISFREIKGSKADVLARSVFVGKKKADREVSFGEIKVVFAKK